MCCVSLSDSVLLNLFNLKLNKVLQTFHVLLFPLPLVSHTKRGKAGDKKGDGKINNKIIVDVREFRSSLPSLTHAAGNSDYDDDDGVE